MNSKRVRLSIEILEDRTTPTATNIGFGTGVYTSEVAGFKFFQDNASFATTSSAFGYSEASMTKAQQVTTKNGGLTNARLTDAFNGALSWGVTSGRNPTPNTYHDADGIVDITGNVLTGDPNPTGLNGAPFAGLDLAQQNAIFALDPTTPVIRSILSVTNPTASPITTEIGEFTNLGSDNNTTLYATSSGDSSLSPADRWMVTFQNYSGNTSTDPRILEVMQGPGSVASPYSTSWTGNGNRLPYFYYDLTVDPGQTKYLMFFDGLSGQLPKLTGQAASVFNSDATVASAGLLQGLSASQLQNTVNWNFQPYDVADFPGHGVQFYDSNTASWQVLSTADATNLGVSANGQVVADFHGYGVDTYNLNSFVPGQSVNWQPLVPAAGNADPSMLSVAPNGVVAADFQGYGVHLYDPANAAIGWQRLTPVDPTLLSVSGNSSTSFVVANFAHYGVDEFNYNSSDPNPTYNWYTISNFNAMSLTVASNGVAYADFRGYGLQMFVAGTTWESLETPDTTVFSVDSAGQVAADLNHAGVYLYTSTTGWLPMNTGNASLLTLDSSGDVVGDFPPSGIQIGTLSGFGFLGYQTGDAVLLAASQD